MNNNHYYKMRLFTISTINSLAIKELLYIPAVIHKYDINYIMFSLKRNVESKDKDSLYTVDNINDIRISLFLNSSSTSSNYKIINDNIYKYHLIKDGNDKYHLSKHKMSSLTTFSKTLNSVWFLNNL